MAFPKNSKSALLALATAGGLWAWQNRTKLAGMVQEMQGSRAGRSMRKDFMPSHTATTTPPLGGAYTDAPPSDVLPGEHYGREGI
jgi:hypothetical protein